MTFLFTDIVSSTVIAQQFPDALPNLLAGHHAILNGAAQAHYGHVFRIVGDAFQIAYYSASNALHAVLAVQTALQQEAWQPMPITVRMGLNTGLVQVETQLVGHLACGLPLSVRVRNWAVGDFKFRPFYKQANSNSKNLNFLRL